VDWEAHRRFLGLKNELGQVIHQQRRLAQQRRDAVRTVPSRHKIQAARPFEQQLREIVEQRYLLELSAMEARYEARGCAGCPEHRVEQEQAEFRRRAALNRLEARHRERRVDQQRGQLPDPPRNPSQAERHTLGGRIASPAVDLALREMGVSPETRKATRVCLTIASGASQALLKTAMEASRAAVQTSRHLAQAGVGVILGTIAAPFTGGASLQAGLREGTQNLAAAAGEAGRGALRAGEAAGQGLADVTHTVFRNLLPWELRATTDLVSGNPSSGIAPVLPESLRRALILAGALPGSPMVAAMRLASDVSRTVYSAPNRGLEVDR
jgi:hypothetical protein